MAEDHSRILVSKKISDSSLARAIAINAAEMSRGTSLPISDADTITINVNAARKSSSNLLRKVSDSRLLGTADLKFALAIAKQAATGDLNPEEANKVDEDDQHGGEEEFTAFNHVGLTSEEAEAALNEYGLNKLPEKKVSKLFIFFQQLWQVSLLYFYCVLHVSLFRHLTPVLFHFSLLLSPCPA